jgi:alkylation response protein AidB-like acyl-CoA dehydrogenase
VDLSLTEDQTALSDLLGRILSDRCPPERLRELEAEPDWFARDAWADLAKADLLGLCLPDADGGGGYGFLEAALMLEQVGRALAPVPLFATLVLGAMPVAEFGTDGQRRTLLDPMIVGDLVLTAALVEAGDDRPPAIPATSARPSDSGGWVLDGEKVLVPAAHLAGRILVPAATGDGATTVFLVDPSADGVSLERQVSTNLEPLGTVRLAGVRVGADDVLGAVDGGALIVDWITERAVAGLCALQAGVCEAALRLTATYTSEREQFGAKIATFQAVAQRAADAYIDTEAVRLTARQAAWRIGEGFDAADAVAVAKYWSAVGGQRVVHAAQHLHGGIGVDASYPVHRCFRWAKHLELLLGGGTRHLVRLGAVLADRAVLLSDSTSESRPAGDQRGPGQGSPG